VAIFGTGEVNTLPVFGTPKSGGSRAWEATGGINMRIRADEEIRRELREQLLVLKGLGVKTVDVSYSGSGDEGYVNGVILTPKLENFDDGRLQDLLYDYLDPAHVGDWVNNEGGFGEIQISLETGRVKGVVNLNEVSYKTTKLTDQL
jgi:hypothetical protein